MASTTQPVLEVTPKTRSVVKAMTALLLLALHSTAIADSEVEIQILRRAAQSYAVCADNAYGPLTKEEASLAIEVFSIAIIDKLGKALQLDSASGDDSLTPYRVFMSEDMLIGMLYAETIRGTPLYQERKEKLRLSLELNRERTHLVLWSENECTELYKELK